MSPIQQMLLGAGGAVATKTYVDDVFSTFLYTGTGSAQTINNGIDLANEGGMVWFKPRTTGGSSYNNHSIVDTARVDSSGRGKSIYPNLTEAEYSPEGTANITTSFNSNGFTTGTNANNATNTQTLASWTFRKAPGFFDVVTYTGNATAGRTVAHSLGSIPGCIMVKCTTDSRPWAVYHRGMGNGKSMPLNGNNAEHDSTTYWNDTDPTASVFTVGTANDTNKSGETYVAYLFAGGESTAATARSVEFDGSNDYLYTSTSHSDVSFGTGNFTIELWFRYDGSDLASTNDTLIDTRNGDSGGNGNHGWTLWVRTNGHLALYTSGSDGEGYAVESNTVLSVGKWYHAAITRESNTYRLFLNGVLDDTNTQSSSADAGSNFYIGYKANYPGSSLTYWNGLISNVRILKGTALYTSSFRPPTEPLTNITNTKFLWAQSSTVTTGTVNPMTLTNSGTTASTDSPFDDPAAFKFGDAGDQNVIKCGSFIASTGSPHTVNVGFEPQWVLIKRSGTLIGDWTIIDKMRGWVGDTSSSETKRLLANSNGAEDGVADMSGLTSTGFTVDDGGIVNQSGHNYIYVAIRRPDGYVGKPPELGTGVFAMDTGASSSTIPNYTSGFPVDLSFRKNKTGTSFWQTSARLIQGNAVWLNSTNAEGSSSGEMFDSNVGYGADNNGSNFQNWMFKRHAGFDVVAYKGTGTTHQIAHSLNKTVEMFWLKSRDSSANWMVWHKGLNGGTNPEQYFIRLNLNNAESQGSSFGDTAPTSTHFTVGASSNAINTDGDDCIAMLFASVDGISKVGYYSGSNSSQTISTGFAPRFLVMKKVDTVQGWVVLDTVRGWGSGGDERLEFHNSNAQNDNIDFGAPTSSGFTLVGNVEKSNQSGGSYIYYAHA